MGTEREDDGVSATPERAVIAGQRTIKGSVEHRASEVACWARVDWFPWALILVPSACSDWYSHSVGRVSHSQAMVAWLASVLAAAQEMRDSR